MRRTIALLLVIPAVLGLAGGVFALCTLPTLSLVLLPIGLGCLVVANRLWKANEPPT
jgi:hypothetical protein